MLQCHFYTAVSAACIKLGLMNLPPTAQQRRLACLGVAGMSFYTLANAWTVYASGSLDSVSCSGRFQRLYCVAGAGLGRLYSPNSAWLGYVLFECIVGVFFFLVAWGGYVRSKA